MTEESLHDQHGQFVPLIAAIDRMGGELESGSPVLLRAEAGVVHETLVHELIPHAIGEGRTVFPVLRRVTGSDEATKEMLQEHREISRLTDELDRVRGDLLKAGVGGEAAEKMQALLQELKTTVERHFAEEEKYCFEVLKHELSAEEAKDLCDALEQATHDVRRTIECGGGPSYT